MSKRFMASAVALVCASAFSPIFAQSGAPKTAPKPEPKPSKAAPANVDPTLPTRADLALAYVRFERALAANPPKDERLTEINSIFDKLTVAFFAGESRRAIETMNELTLELDPNTTGADSDRLAMAFRASIDPPMLYAGWPPRAALEIVQMYTPNASAPPKEPLRFVLLDASNAECASATIPPPSAEARGAHVDLAFTRDKLAAGCYRIALDIKGREPRVIGRCYAVERALDSVRSANDDRLKRVENDKPKLLRAIETCRARNQLLTERPSKSASAQFLADPITLQRDVAHEIEELEAGRDPYYRRAGDLWRVFRTGTSLIPLHTFAPPAAAEGKPLPLVIALHGAGGDENVFFQGYGGGRLVELARERGFLLAAPELGFSFSDGKRFDALLTSLTRDYTIDEKRIYLLGHSMGAGVAGILAASKKPKLAAVVCFAGAPPEDKTDIAPTLVIIGEHDPLADPQAAAERIEKERASGVPIEFRSAPGQGHTLPVGHYLGGAVDWLLAHERNADLSESPR